MATKYLYSNQFAQKLPGGDNLYFRTVTGYTLDTQGKVTGSRTILYYTGIPGGRDKNGNTWTPGTNDDASTFYSGGFVRAAESTDKGKSFTARTYTQSDADAGRIPPGKNVGDPILGQSALQSLNTPGGAINTAVQNSVINSAVKQQPGLAPQLAAKLQNTPTDSSNPGGGGGGGGGGDGDSPSPEGGADLSDFDAPNIEANKQQSAESFGNWVYPTDIGNNEQDFIKFTMIEYLSKPLGTLTTFERFDNDKRKKKRLGTVILPTQPSITDTNTVDWQQEGINPLQSAGARFALAASGRDPEGAVSATVDNVIANLKDDQASFKDYLRVWAAGQAVGVNLLSRVSGAVVNPNMELLFNGPQLRAFNFSFRLSPRDEKEANQVKSIIRFFKQGMAVRKAEKGVFLKTPNIFDIQYCFKNTDTLHPALSQIKTCALTSCTVDYTPDGSYMTFDDGTMTSYNLTLQFSELEPIYDTDYTPIDTKTGINNLSF